MSRMSSWHRLLDQIETEALDESASLAGALRKCVALGGRTGSEQLRDWATLELEGYKDLDENPLARLSVGTRAAEDRRHHG